MRFVPQSADKAKRLAKRLRKYSMGSISEKLPQVSLSMAQKTIAIVLGFRDWFDLTKTAASVDAPDLTDRRVPYGQMSVRRRYQADRFMAMLSVPKETGFALVSLLLPSGDINEERRFFSSRPADILIPRRWIDQSRDNGLRMDSSFWLDVSDTVEQFDLDLSDDVEINLATSIVLERLAFGTHVGHFRASPFTSVNVTALADKATGYFAVIIPANNFYQGYFLVDMSDDLVDRNIALLRSTLSASGTPASKLERAVIAAAEASLCQVSLHPDKTGQPETRIALFGSIIQKLTGANYFIVTGNEEAHGFTTNTEFFKAENHNEARQIVNNHPLAIACKMKASLKIADLFK